MRNCTTEERGLLKELSLFFPHLRVPELYGVIWSKKFPLSPLEIAFPLTRYRNKNRAFFLVLTDVFFQLHRPVPVLHNPSYIFLALSFTPGYPQVFVLIRPFFLSSITVSYFLFNSLYFLNNSTFITQRSLWGTMEAAMLPNLVRWFTMFGTASYTQ
jgi:hypothetical protein